jgi:hypothetical protein
MRIIGTFTQYDRRDHTTQADSDSEIALLDQRE